MRLNGTALVVLVAALAGLGASIAFVSAQFNDEQDWMMARYGSGMMGYASTGGGDPVGGPAEARMRAQQFADQLDLGVGEVMRFSNHYYAQLEDDGRPATEVLVDPATGAVWLEFGPAMMWNTRFGMMSDFRLRDDGGMMGDGMMGDGMMGDGMMGDGMGTGTMGGGMMGDAPVPESDRPTGDRQISAADATRIAGEWLSKAGPGMGVEDAEAFPGYYTLHVVEDGKLSGMLSVSSSTGAVWYHSWHGRFVSMAE